MGSPGSSPLTSSSRCSFRLGGWHQHVDADKIKIVNIGGVEYQHNIEDETMIRTDDFKEVGVWNTKTQEIDFEDEEKVKEKVVGLGCHFFPRLYR